MLLSNISQGQDNKVNLWEGVAVAREVDEATDVTFEVFGPETHVTAVVPMALGLVEKPTSVAVQPAAKAIDGKPSSNKDEGIVRVSDNTRCIVYGLLQRTVQGMLDFDYLCN
ncbi:ATP-citrate synthase, partial [Phytophthora megakarya]